MDGNSKHFRQYIGNTRAFCDRLHRTGDAFFLSGLRGGVRGPDFGGVLVYFSGPARRTGRLEQINAEKSLETDLKYISSREPAA
jgi:hypothetical protein